MANRRGTAASADALGVVVPGAYMTLLIHQCRRMYELDPRSYLDDDPEAALAFEVKEEALAARAEALIARRAAARDPVYVRRELIGSNVLAAPPGVPMFAKTLGNREWRKHGSYRVTADDVITPSELWPPLTSRVLDPNDPLPDEWPCAPRQPRTP